MSKNVPIGLIIPTSDGIIVFDALNNADEGRDVLVGGVKKVGLDPAQIKYLIIGHGHNDHSGTEMPTRMSLAAFEHVFNDFAKKQNAETALGSHSDILVNKLPAMEALGKQYPTGPHPFLYGPQRFGRYLDIMLECGRARLAALESGSS